MSGTPSTFFTIVYTTDSGDLRWVGLRSRVDVDTWLAENEYKALVIEAASGATIEDRT